MKQLKSKVFELRRLFEELIPAASISEPFVSFDDSADALAVLRFMQKHDFDVVGVRVEGLPAGYVTQKDLTVSGSIGGRILPFCDTECLSERDSMLKAVLVVHQRGHAFVTFSDKVAGIITRGDLQKVPVRMWLFNLISLLEMNMLRLIRERYPDGQWRDLMKPHRIQKAESILTDRLSRNAATDLADCLEFSDKSCILVGTDDLRLLFGESKRAAFDFLRAVENLRNELAHAQDIITGNWPDLVGFSAKIEKALEETEKVNGAMC